MSAGKPLKTYDLSQTFIVVSGIRMSGFGPDDVLELENDEDIGTPSMSADGQGTFSRSNNFGMTVTITLQETSLAYRQLAEAMQEQELEDAIAQRPFLMRDTISGDEISDQYATFMAAPAMSKGKEAGTRVFKLWLPNGRRNAKYGASLTV